MYVFGGYVKGSKSNDLWSYHFETGEWTELDAGDYFITDPKYHKNHAGEKPVPRIGAGIIYHNQSLYLYGGHDEQNEKLEDLWKFDLTTNQWSIIEVEGNKPTGRNGHTMVVINNKIVMFGGILEITKETDEVFIFDFTSNRWITYESPSYVFGGASPKMIRLDDDFEDKSQIGGNSSKAAAMKKNKHTSSMPTLNNTMLPDLKANYSSSKFAPQFTSTMTNN